MNNEKYGILTDSFGDILASGQNSSNIGKAGNDRDERKVSHSDNTRKSSQKESKDSHTKVHSFKLNIEIVKTISDISYWQRRSIREVVEDALRLYIDNTPNEDKCPRKNNNR